MASSDAKAALTSGSYLSMINVLMQLRKVCNHPDLFAGRPIVSPLDLVGIELKWPDVCVDMWKSLDTLESFQTVNLVRTTYEEMTTWQADSILKLEDSNVQLLENLPDDKFWSKGLESIQSFRCVRVKAVKYYLE